MALYLGSGGKRKIYLNNIAYVLNLVSIAPTINSIGLLSSDNYILQDCNGIYLLPSDYTNSIVDLILLSSDNYILQDYNGIYLTFKESE